jgi:hypothetical protein
LSEADWWPDGVGALWLDSLRIPSEAWMRPLVGHLGLPAGVDPDVVERVYETALADRAALLEATAALPSFPGLDGATTREVVIRAMHHLGELASDAAAAAFERWARTFVVTHEVTVTLFSWRMVLLGFLRAPADAPPPALAARRERLDADFSEERAEAF